MNSHIPDGAEVTLGVGVDCEWRPEPPVEDGVFLTACGHILTSEDDPRDWTTQFCPGCGKPHRLVYPAHSQEPSRGKA